MKKLIPQAKLPKRATSGAVGFDVYSTHDTIIPPYTTIPIHTGLAMSIPKPLYLRIASRSSLAAKNINVTGGVVDNDYHGEIKVLLQNTSNKPFKISTHDRIAQFIFEVYNTPCLTISSKLDNTKQEKGGFGSTNHPSKDYTFIN